MTFNNSYERKIKHWDKDQTLQEQDQKLQEKDQTLQEQDL
jgi:hypothetical protein